MKQTFLITGGAGFIGTNLASYLVEQGHEVIVVDDLSAGLNRDVLPEVVSFHQLDVRETDSLSQLMTDVDVVMHLAAMPRVQYSIDERAVTHDVNVNGTLSVLEAAKQAGVRRIVLASTSAIYGDQETLPLNTNQQPAPKSPYALHKLINEQTLKLWSELYDIETVSLRFFNVYGPHFDPDGPYALVIGKFLDRLKKGQTLQITGDGDQTRDFIHVADVASALYRAAISDAVGNGEVFNVGSGVQTTINQLAEALGGEVEHIPARHEPRNGQADIAETIAILEWQPTIALIDGIAALKQDYLDS